MGLEKKASGAIFALQAIMSPNQRLPNETLFRFSFGAVRTVVDRCRRRRLNRNIVCLSFFHILVCDCSCVQLCVQRSDDCIDHRFVSYMIQGCHTQWSLNYINFLLLRSPMLAHCLLFIPFFIHSYAPTARDWHKRKIWGFI